MKPFKPVTCPNCRSVAVGDYGVKVNPRFECIDCGTKIDGYYDPFQDALPCFMANALNIELARRERIGGPWAV